MQTSLPGTALAAYVARQLDVFFPDRAHDARELAQPVGRALDRLEHCFARIGQRYYRRDGQACFDHLNTDQYAAFLYLLGNTVHRDGGEEALAAKTYALNKALHGVDVFYAVALPDVFCFVHPVGTVIGRGRFGDFFCAYQNCTVGGDLDGNLPSFGCGVVMYGGSRVVGKAAIGDNCVIGAGASVIGQDAPSDHAVFGASPSLILRPTRRNVIRDVFEYREDGG